ncbi:T9SS type A sorting domain-containing protein [candidate division KSB1 bacterium]|nr:T9SS type A sorting domain-containing protein [candidate division KSB1 bacterium]
MSILKKTSDPAKAIELKIRNLKCTYKMEKKGMKKIVLILLFVYGALYAITDWKDIGPPCAVTLGVYCHPTEANIIYFIADTGHLFRSMDKGKTWERISQTVALATMPNRQYRGGEHAVAVDPRPGHGNIVYFAPGQSGAGLWKSTDYGTTWQKTLGSDFLGAAVVAVDYNGVVICITGGLQIYSSADGGDTWNNYSIPFRLDSNWYKPVGYKIDIEITTDNVVWVSNRFKDTGIYYTADFGQTWNQKLPDTWIVDLTCSPVDPSLILALEQDGRIFRSSDGGVTFPQTGMVSQNNYWSFSTWPPHRGGISINSAGTVIAVGRFSMGRSTDSGLTFKDIPEAELNYSAPDWPFIDRKTTDQALKCCDISSSPVDTSFWIYGDGAMLKISQDNGLSWKGGNNDGAHGLWMYGSPCIDADDPNVFHVACVDFGHAYTTDMGKTWITSETQRISCQGVTQDPNDHKIFYKATKKNNGTVLSIFKSIDRGHIFTKLSDISLADDTYGGRIFVDPTDSKTIYCTIRGGKGVYRSTDGGENFETIYSKTNIHHSAITKSGNVFFHIWNGYGFCRYIKAADEWNDIAPNYGVDGFAVHPEDENIIYINADGKLYKTQNGLSAAPDWELLGEYSGRQIYIDPYKPDYMLMMTDGKNQGMMYSDDAGKTWVSIHQNHGTPFVWGFVAGGPLAKGRVYTFDATACYIEDIYKNNVAVREKDVNIVPRSAELGAAYPNPFNAGTRIPFEVSDNAGSVRLEIYDLLGRKVCTLVNGLKPVGKHVVFWNGRDEGGAEISSGVYLIKFSFENSYTTRKVLLLK